MLKNLALGFENSLPAAQKFNMGVANIGDHGNVGPYHAPQIRDLPEVVHTGLNHSGLMLRLQPQQRQRRADIVIEVCRCLQHLELRSQCRRHHIFCCGLAHASSDLDKGNLKAVPIGRRQVPQRKARVSYLDVKFVRTQIFRRLGA